MTQQVVLPTQNCDPHEEKNCGSHETKLSSYMLVLFVRASKSCRRADAHLQKNGESVQNLYFLMQNRKKAFFMIWAKFYKKKLMLYMFMAF